MPQGLPQLGGPDARVADVVALYNESRALFAPIGCDVRAARARSRAAAGRWRWTTAPQVVVGRSEARARLGRFARLLPQLLAQQTQRRCERADLRYTNGFALTLGAAAGAGGRRRTCRTAAYAQAST